MRTKFGMAVVVVALLAYSQQSSPPPQVKPDFRINPAKPFVYIDFGRVEPRKPVRQGEPGQGVWLRLVNNCRLPIEVKKSGSDENPEMEHLVVYDEPYLTLITADGKQHPEHRPRSEMPHGYNFDLVGSLVVVPGGALEFCVPVNHVAADWHIEVPFEFKFSDDPCCQPRMQVLFKLSDVPEKYRHEFDRTYR